MPATIDDKGNASVTCECGKPLTKVNEYGMFCDDMCGYKESIKASTLLDAIIEDVCMNLNIIPTEELTEEDLLKMLEEFNKREPTM